MGWRGGWSGWGGSLWIFSPGRNCAIAFAMTGMAHDLVIDRTERICRAVEACLRAAEAEHGGKSA